MGTGLSIDLAFAPKVSFALHQNSVPVLRELAVVNSGQEAWEDLVLSLASEPSFFQPRNWWLSRVSPEQRYNISDLDLSLDGGQLARLSEAEKGEVRLELRRGDEVLCQLARPVELLARNQWGGLNQFPELIAAFVRPNDPAVDRVLKKAAELLFKHGKDPALEGYKWGGKQRVWEIMSAIWGAVCSLGLDYSLPPAGFEQLGQKVRSPEQIIQNGLATCLDLSLLFASCIEQCQLHPLLVFIEGHAFTGCWLVPEVFAVTTIDDVAALRKRIQLQEIQLFEPTLAVRSQHEPAKFKWSGEVGGRQVSEKESRAFQMAIDVQRARMERILPLASEESLARPAGGEAQEEAGQDSLDLEEAPDFVEMETRERQAESSRPQDRLDRWQRKLLDLSLRNNLLNFRASKKVVELLAPDPGKLEDLLAAGIRFKLRPGQRLMQGGDPRDQSIHQARHCEEVSREHALDALDEKELFTKLSDQEMESRLVELFRAARLSLQEGGANTLFLVLGFLVWNQGGKDERRLRAPLVLVPVSLSRQAVRSGFSLAMHEDEPRFNLTLLEMLRQDFRLSMPKLEGELPRDDSGVDVAGIWRTVATAIKDMAGWEVSEDVCLGQFSFAKYLMWKDLVERTDQLRENPVVRHLIDTPLQAYAGHSEFFVPEQLDEVLAPVDNFCPLPADSSQLSAVVAASRGQDFVLVGPPGTGKSQTIANLIAQCLGEGKTVLFVAEKTAALEVVYRRLRNLGLGEFCLELHSNKANKLEVLKQLKESWEAQVRGDGETWQREGARMAELRGRLNSLVKSLHRPWPNGLSVFVAISKVLASRDTTTLALSWQSPDTHDKADLDKLLELSAKLGINAAEVVGGAEAGFGIVTARAWSPSWEKDLTDSLKKMIPLCEEVQKATQAFLSATKLPHVALTGDVREALVDLAGILPEAAGRDWGFLMKPEAPAIIDRMRNGLALVAKRMQSLTSLREQGNTLSSCFIQGERTLGPWSDLESRAETIIARLGEGLAMLERGLVRPAGPSGELANLLELKAQIKTLLSESKAMAQSFAERIEQGRSLTEQRQDSWGHLSIRYRPEVLAIDLDAQMTAWQEAKAAWWPKSFFGRRKVSKVLMAHAEAGQATKPDCEADLQWLAAVRELDAKLENYADLKDRASGAWDWDAWESMAQLAFCDVQNALETATKQQELLFEVRELDANIASFDDLHELTAGLWRGLETTAEGINTAQNLMQGLTQGLAALYDQPLAFNNGLAAIAALVGTDNVLLHSGGDVVRCGADLKAADLRYQEALGQLGSLLGEDNTHASRYLESLEPALLHKQCLAILNNARLLHPWCAWNQASSEGHAQGMGALVKALGRGDVTSEQARDVFAANYCRWWLNAAVDTDQLLQRFVSAEHEQMITEFRKLDDKLISLAKNHIRAVLRKGIPGAEDVHKTSEWGLLRREIEKKRKHLPLRQLMEKLPSALTTLTPCLLMSPLSIAQYLPPGRANFDLVVFDEASQIPVWDAIGAMARGRRVIVVGDPKQLPPTNFFNRAEDEEADDEVEVGGDMESILDECVSAGLPKLRLNWHYRSRHESLIAFSNHRYYKGGLVTFPSPVTSDRAISLNLVDGGVYDKGGSRTNQAEARAVVADIVAKLHDLDFVAGGNSIGVVTFNSQQQRLIEDLLDEERHKDPALDRFFGDEQIEPVFVKNLENVQGDERDVMYFSITYGPDLAGRVSMNFGPLNKDGGERRLNVAVTRARHELKVFTSLSPEQIDLSRTKAKGVADLKLFLEYARRGVRALIEEVSPPRGDFDSFFEEIVAEALSKRGWSVHAQVGVSAFRIDLGVVDPDLPGAYLAGVECDGASYHRAATARDRDKLREQVLRGLGWEIVRTWSTDWWHDAERAANKLDERLKVILERSRQEKKLQQKQGQQQAKPHGKAKTAQPDTEMSASTEEMGPSELESIRSVKAVTPESNPAHKEAYAARVQAAPMGQPAEPTKNDPLDLLSDGHEPELAAAIREIVALEGPIRDDVLAKRIAKLCGFYKAGAKIREKVLKIARREFKFAKEEGGVFVWPLGSQPGHWEMFRFSIGEAKRPADEISLAELAALARTLRANLDPEEDAAAAMAKAMGLQRLRAATRKRLEQAWRLAANQQT